jgi:hypothetical protein
MRSRLSEPPPSRGEAPGFRRSQCRGRLRRLPSVPIAGETRRLSRSHAGASERPEPRDRWGTALLARTDIRIPAALSRCQNIDVNSRSETPSIGMKAGVRDHVPCAATPRQYLEQGSRGHGTGPRSVPCHLHDESRSEFVLIATHSQLVSFPCKPAHRCGRLVLKLRVISGSDGSGDLTVA